MDSLSLKDYLGRTDIAYSGVAAVDDEFLSFRQANSSCMRLNNTDNHLLLSNNFTFLVMVRPVGGRAPLFDFRGQGGGPHFA